MEIQDVMIIGAGMAGLTAARSLSDGGFHPLLLDKGRGVGGRVATRWQGSRDQITGRWDHGAQFVTLRSTALRDHLAAWGALEVLEDWIPSPADPRLARRIARTGLNTFAKQLAEGLNIRTGARAVQLQPDASGWRITTETGDTFRTRRLMCTLPAPQFLDLARESELELTDSERAALSSVQYTRCLSLLAETRDPVQKPGSGWWQAGTGVLDTVIDHMRKGISASPTVTAHATPAFSMEWYERDRTTAASVLRAALEDFLGQPILSARVHGWKFANALRRIPSPFLELDSGIILAGDGFAAGDGTEAPAGLPARIESAMLSGLYAARHFAEEAFRTG